GAPPARLSDDRRHGVPRLVRRRLPAVRHAKSETRRFSTPCAPRKSPVINLSPSGATDADCKKPTTNGPPNDAARDRKSDLRRPAVGRRPCAELRGGAQTPHPDHDGE